MVPCGTGQEVQPKIEAARAKVKELGHAGYLSSTQVWGLQHQLDAIADQLNNSFALHLDLSQFQSRVGAGGQELQAGDCERTSPPASGTSSSAAT
jgi:hypothetical protein